MLERAWRFKSSPGHQNKKLSNPHFANAGFALRKPRGLFQLRALFLQHQALAFVGSQPCCSKPQLTLSWAPKKKLSNPHFANAGFALRKPRGLFQLRARSACVRWLAAMLLETPTLPLLGTKLKIYRAHTLPMRVSRFENQEDYSSCAPSFFNIRRLRSLARSHAARSPDSPFPGHQSPKTPQNGAFTV